MAYFFIYSIDLSMQAFQYTIEHNFSYLCLGCDKFNFQAATNGQHWKYQVACSIQYTRGIWHRVYQEARSKWTNQEDSEH